MNWRRGETVKVVLVLLERGGETRMEGTPFNWAI